MDVKEGSPLVYQLVSCKYPVDLKYNTIVCLYVIIMLIINRILLFHLLGKLSKFQINAIKVYVTNGLFFDN